MATGTLRNLLVRIGADVTGLRQGLRAAQKDVKYFGRNVTGSLKEMRGTIGKTFATLGGGLLIKGGIQDAMRFEALMATLGESMGESRLEFEKWQKTVGGTLGFSMLQSAELANMLSLNFKAISVDTEDLVKKTTDMMELAALISNKRGMTMTEVSNRIRSAMNQEADGAMELGVDVRVAAIKAGKAYQELAAGAPWDSLSEGMRKTILYHHIFEQVSTNLGTTLQDTTAQRMAVFTAALANLKMALGQAFLPIMHTVLPLLTRLANALYRALQYVAAFTKALFGGGFKYKAPISEGDVATTNKQAAALGGVGDAAESAGNKSEKAAKKAKKAWSGTFGFDEVHTIKDPEPAAAGAGGGGGGGGGLGDLGGLGGDEPFGNPFRPFSEGLDELVEKMKKYTEPIRSFFIKVWGEISGYAIEKFNQIRDWWVENSGQIGEAWQNVWDVVGPVVKLVVDYIWESIKGLIDGVILFFTGLIDFFTGIFTGDWKKAWDGLKDMVVGAFLAVWNFLNLSFFGGIKKLILNLVKKGGKFFMTFADDIVLWFKGGGLKLKNIFDDVIKTVSGWFKNFGAFMRQTWDDIVHSIQTKWAEFTLNLKVSAQRAWDFIKDVFKDAAGWFGRTVITPIINKFAEIKDVFTENIGAGFKKLFNSAVKPLNNMIDVLNAVKNKIPLASSLPNIPKLPTLAQGGITSGPTLAMVGDNVGGREVIAPLDRLQGMLTNAVIQAMQLGNGGGGNQQQGDVVLNIDGRTLARLVKPYLDKEANRVGTDVRIRTI